MLKALCFASDTIQMLREVMVTAAVVAMLLLKTVKARRSFAQICNII